MLSFGETMASNCREREVDATQNATQMYSCSRDRQDQEKELSAIWLFRGILPCSMGSEEVSLRKWHLS